MGLFTPAKWKVYQNQKLGNKFDPVLSLAFNSRRRDYAMSNFDNYVRQFNDSVNIASTTKKPDVFFERYDFALQRIIAVIYMRKYVKVKMNSPEKSANELIDRKQEFIRDLISRRAEVLKEKLTKLKTPASKKKNIAKFEEEFIPYHTEMSQENIDYIKRTVDYYMRNCE